VSSVVGHWGRETVGFSVGGKQGERCLAH
jgi:hypothetical protein